MNLPQIHLLTTAAALSDKSHQNLMQNIANLDLDFRVRFKSIPVFNNGRIMIRKAFCGTGLSSRNCHWRTCLGYGKSCFSEHPSPSFSSGIRHLRCPIRMTPMNMQDRFRHCLTMNVWQQKKWWPLRIIQKKLYTEQIKYIKHMHTHKNKKFSECLFKMYNIVACSTTR